MKEVVINQFHIGEFEFSLVSVTAIMSGLESNEYSMSFNRVRFLDRLFILQWRREIPLP